MPTIPTKSYTVSEKTELSDVCVYLSLCLVFKHGLFCVFHQVGNRDTLTSVAARFDTTPSELTGLNKLNSNFIYPGQQLLVPDKSAAASVAGSSDGTDGDGASAGGGTDDKQRHVSSDDIPLEEKGELLAGVLNSYCNGFVGLCTLRNVT